MKRPYFNQEDRELMKTDTYVGACLLLNLAIRKFKRSVYKEYGWIRGWWMLRQYNKIKMYEPRKGNQQRIL